MLVKFIENKVSFPNPRNKDITSELEEISEVISCRLCQPVDHKALSGIFNQDITKMNFHTLSMSLIFLEPPSRRGAVLTAPHPHPTLTHPYTRDMASLSAPQSRRDFRVTKTLKSGRIMREHSGVMIMFYTLKRVWVLHLHM